LHYEDTIMFAEPTTSTARLPSPADDPSRAWAPYTPDAANPWDLRKAGHLYRRAGFGATWQQLQRALADGPQRTVDALLRPQGDLAAFRRRFDGFEASANSADGLRAWWLRRMLESPHPLEEKMTLFWHGHFAIGAAKQSSPRVLSPYLKLLRSQALGRFDALLDSISREPAVLVGADGGANRRGKPAESYARAMLEAFSSGEGQCSPQDIKEAARAFTGQFVLHDEYRFVQREHDPGVKDVLGQKGNWKGEDIVRIVLGHPATPRRIVQKLYRWLLSETSEPEDSLLAPLTSAFAKDFDIGKLVETMVRSNLFFSSAAYRQRIKCPVEYALGIVHALEAIAPTAPLGNHLAILGQNLLNPPTVHGWPGGKAWLNRFTLAGRNNLALALLIGEEPYADAVNPQAIVERPGLRDRASTGQFLVDLFLQGDAPPDAVKCLNDSKLPAGDLARQSRQLAHAVVTLPEFHLA
jgi:uncharacterized protein (DUF1800 family)